MGQFICLTQSISDSNDILDSEWPIVCFMCVCVCMYVGVCYVCMYA